MLLPVWATGQALPSYEADPLWKAEVIDNNICQAEGCNNDTGIVSFFYEKDTLVEGVTYLKAGFGDEMQKGRGHFREVISAWNLKRYTYANPLMMMSF